MLAMRFCAYLTSNEMWFKLKQPEIKEGVIDIYYMSFLMNGF